MRIPSERLHERSNLDMPEVSVVMPVYNQQKFVGAAIRSILNQSFEDFELVIVDDGSTDNTLQVVSTFDDERIRLIRAEHGGFIEALKIGTAQAKGKWVARMDSDDISAPTRLEKQLAFLKQHPDCKFVTTIYGILTPRDKALAPATSERWRFISKSDITLDTVPFCDPGTMFHRETALTKGYDDDLPWEKTLWYSLLDEGKGALLEEPLYFIRWRLGSVSRGQYATPADFSYRIRQKYDPACAPQSVKDRSSSRPSTAEKKTVYYYCAARDFSTARETAFGIWRRHPLNVQAMKLVLLSLGYRSFTEISGPAGLRLVPTRMTDIGMNLVS